VVKNLVEMVVYLAVAALTAFLVGAFVDGGSQLFGHDDATANAAGWGACLTSFAFFALTGRPMKGGVS
jgi:hypothetical protein